MALVYADDKGNVYDYPGMTPTFRTGNRLVRVNIDDLISIPYGSTLYFLPGRYPVSYDSKQKSFSPILKSLEGKPIWAVSSFLSSGYLRTFLPAFQKTETAPILPLWAYCGVVFMNENFFVPAVRIDDDPRSDPEIHENKKELTRAVHQKKSAYPKNRLVQQLAHCATQYGCLCARNFFLERHEAPIPTSPACNADCVGCLSLQEKDIGFVESQPRLTFKPSPAEIAEVIFHHVTHVENAVASFGQGCEGEPLLRADDIAKAIELVRAKTDKGTININTNGSIPDAVGKLINAGLDSIRISFNSPTERYYTRYHRPKIFAYQDVLKSLAIALDRKIFVSINLFFMPGFTDMTSEVDSLFEFLDQFPINMIQTRNMNIDPDFYFDAIGYQESEPIGIPKLIHKIKERYPALRLGYYNPPKESF